MEWQGSEAVTEAFRSWFGERNEFELVDATVGEVGGRLHLSWRFRLRPAPFGIGDGWHVIEQQAYADATDTIAALDLLCSGFQPEPKTANLSKPRWPDRQAPRGSLLRPWRTASSRVSSRSVCAVTVTAARCRGLMTTRADGDGLILIGSFWSPIRHIRSWET
jgi:hypothetical protein